MHQVGALPQTPLGELRTSPNPLAVFKGPILVRGERKKGRKGGKGKKGKEGKGNGIKGEIMKEMEKWERAGKGERE